MTYLNELFKESGNYECLSKYWYDRSMLYAYMLYQLVADGDGDPEDFFKAMREDQFIDKDDEWDYRED